VFLGLPNDRQFLALARYRLAHLFPYLPDQPGYNKRLRRLGPKIARCINYLAFTSPSFCDAIWLLDFTPVPCGQSRETTRRSQFAGLAGYGYCRSHSRYLWGFRLYLVCARDGTPIGFELAPANAPEREVAKELLERIPLADRVLIADKGFAGQDFERFVADQGATRCVLTVATNRAATARWASSANASNRCSGPARAGSDSSATALAPSPACACASRRGSSPSPPASGTTGRSATPAATSPPMPSNTESTI
jgi:Transposase DDE domain